MSKSEARRAKDAIRNLDPVRQQRKRESSSRRYKERMATPEGRVIILAQRAASAAKQDRAKENADSLAYYHKNKEIIAFKIAARKYGISVERVRELSTETRCHACGEEHPGESKRTWPLHIDHDHSTGQIRGMLCPGCNHAIGNARDSPARLRALASYVEKHAQLRLIK